MLGYFLIVVGIAIVLYEIVKWIKNPGEGVFDTIFDLALGFPLTAYIGIGLIGWGFYELWK
ncbi:MAG: hypothetical protein ACE5JO_05860 [Candidatus Binatia bacterium]